MAKDIAAELSVQQLQDLLQKQQSRYQELVDRRQKMLADILALDAEIASVSGSAAPRRRGRPPGATASASAAPKAGRGKTVRRRRPRPKNEKSLKVVLHDILSKLKKPITTAEVEEKVLASGYKTNAAGFRQVVYLNLYKNPSLFKNVDSKWTVVDASAEA